MSAGFTPQDYPALLEELKRRGDPDYRAFQQRLVPGVPVTYGVRLPELRGLAKQILREDPLGFLQAAPPVSYEETLLRGLVTGGWKLPWAEKRPLVEDFLPHIDNWAVCDTFCNPLKPSFPGDREALWDFLRPFYPSEKEYEARFAAVMQLSHFVDEEHREEGLALLQQVTHPGYYAKMAVAWALSLWYVKFPRETDALLARRVLEPWVQNKAIQKIRESRRVSREEKDALLSYKS